MNNETKMDTERIVEVKFEYPGVGPTSSIGFIQESAKHILLVYQSIVGYDLCDYIVIPKNFVKEVIELKFKKEIKFK